jgi:hypothetical protein
VLDAGAAGGAAIGSRWMPGSRVVGRTPGRNVAGRVFAGLTRLLLGLRFYDTQCGIKVFHRRYLADYLAHSRVNDLAFDVEMLVLLRNAGATIAEVPTTWRAHTIIGRSDTTRLCRQGWLSAVTDAACDAASP